MRDRLLSFDWSRTALGPLESWPPSLRIAVSICMDSRFPMFVWWGPERINIYNDAYVPVLGAKHPAAFGRPAEPTWREIWHVVGPQADAVMRGGEATWNERVLLVMQRKGYAEDTYFTWSYSPIRDEHGAIVGMFCACVEDTPRVELEEQRDRLLAQVQSERARLADAFAQSPAFLAVMRGPQHVFESVNDRYVEMIGMRNPIGRPVREVVPEVEGQGYFEIMDRVYQTGEPYVGEGMLMMLHRQGREQLEPTYLDFVYQPLRGGDGAVTGILAHGNDVTHRTRIEKELGRALEAAQRARGEAELASRMKDEFLATLSHELRTPLNAIIGWAHMMRREGATPQDLIRGAEVIDRNARAQSAIIEDLLDMSAIISGKARLDVERVELEAILRAAIDTARPMADAKHIRLAASVGEAAGVTLLADPNRLQQVLWNLLSNAFKFTPRDGQVRIEARRLDSGVEVSVADSGQGIAPEFLPFVFDRFRQADASTTRQAGGLGLGLSIVKQLVELHGGTVAVSSAGHGHGATVTVTLPLAAELAGAVAPASRAPAEPHPSASLGVVERSVLARKRVLVVDDEPDARELVKKVLEGCNAHVTVAASCDEALEIARRERFDVLVSDIAMPDKDGHALIQALRSSPEGHNAEIPAIALTAYARPEDRVKALRAGFHMHTAKPVDPDELVAIVASLARR